MLNCQVPQIKQNRRYKKLLNAKNIILLILFLIIGIIVSFYFSCMSYSIIALILKKKKINPNNIIRITNKFLLKLLSLKILLGFIIIAPMLIITGITISLFFLNKILGALSIFIFIVLFFCYIFLVVFRLFFTTPSMFIEEQRALKSIKHSWNLTKGHIKQVFMIFFIIWGISIFINSFITQPLYSSYSNFVFEASWIKASINFVLVALFLFLEAFVFTFQHIFLFYTYIDFKELREITK